MHISALSISVSRDQRSESRRLGDQTGRRKSGYEAIVFESLFTFSCMVELRCEDENFVQLSLVSLLLKIVLTT